MIKSHATLISDIAVSTASSKTNNQYKNLPRSDSEVVLSDKNCPEIFKQKVFENQVRFGDKINIFSILQLASLVELPGSCVFLHWMQWG